MDLNQIRSILYKTFYLNQFIYYQITWLPTSPHPHPQLHPHSHSLLHPHTQIIDLIDLVINCFSDELITLINTFAMVLITFDFI
jgi:hypothetical protein